MTWVSVTERLPPEQEIVLVWVQRNEGFVDMDELRGGRWFGQEYVTHWMPLPGPPTEPARIPSFEEDLAENVKNPVFAKAYEERKRQQDERAKRKK